MRIRSIKPEFWKSEKMASLSRDARLLFIGLWGLADDYGLFRAHPSLIKGEIFAYDDDADVAAWLRALVDAGVVMLYTHGGQRYGAVVNFQEHQKIDRRAASRIPRPPTAESAESATAEAPEAGSPPNPANKTAEPADISAEPADFTPVDQGAGIKGAGIKVSIPECVTPPPAVEPEPPPDFLRFWEAYGRRGSRKQSLAAWQKLHPTPEMVEQMVAAATRYRASVSAPNYQRHAERWLRDEGWNDTVPSKAPSLLTVNGRAVVEASKQHIPNMPLGAASCQCQGCVDYRTRRAQ